MEYSYKVKQRAYRLDPQCWKSYSGKPRDFKRAMEERRVAALKKAQRELESPDVDGPTIFSTSLLTIERKGSNLVITINMERQ